MMKAVLVLVFACTAVLATAEESFAGSSNDEPLDVETFADPAAPQTCCARIKITLTGTAKTKQGANAGTYKYTGTKNGRAYWKKTDNKRAIWYVSQYKDWAIGELKDLGTTRRSIATMSDHQVECPYTNYNRAVWKYWNSGWKVCTNNIKLECIDVNECTFNQHNCGTGTNCQNTMASFKCVCKPGGYKNLKTVGGKQTCEKAKIGAWNCDDRMSVRRYGPPYCQTGFYTTEKDGVPGAQCCNMKKNIWGEYDGDESKLRCTPCTRPPCCERNTIGARYGKKK